MNRNIFKRSCFTLVELLVAMGVFIVMLGLMLQFFSGARHVWSGMERRNGVYSGARVSMDLITSLLRSQISTEKNIPFVIHRAQYTDPLTGRKNDAVCFFTDTRFSINSNDPICAVRFSMSNDNKLKIQILDSSDATNYKAFLRPFKATGNSYADIDAAGAGLEDVLKVKTAETVAERVTGFSIFNPSSSTTSYVIPDMVVICLYMLDQGSYDIWKGMPESSTAEKDRKLQYLQQNERVFSRTVFFGDISKTVN